MKGWAEVLPRYAIVPHQNFAYTQGKNSADIALVIDAMDLLHSGRFDGFCLVSSDSDFTRLASRVREEGLDAYGFGQRKTPEAFRQACKRFFFTENLSTEPAIISGFAPAAPAKDNPADAVPLIRTAMTELEDDDGWIALGAARHPALQDRPRLRHPHLRRLQAVDADRQDRPLRDRPQGRADPPAPEGEPENLSAPSSSA